MRRKKLDEKMPYVLYFIFSNGFFPPFPFSFFYQLVYLLFIFFKIKSQQSFLCLPEDFFFLFFFESKVFYIYI